MGDEKELKAVAKNTADAEFLTAHSGFQFLLSLLKRQSEEYKFPRWIPKTVKSIVVDRRRFVDYFMYFLPLFDEILKEITKFTRQGWKVSPLAVNFRCTTRIVPPESITYNLEVRVKNSPLWLKVKQSGLKTHARSWKNKMNRQYRWKMKCWPKKKLWTLFIVDSSSKGDERGKENQYYFQPSDLDRCDKIVALKGVIFTIKIGLQGKAARDHGPPATLLNASALQVFGRRVHFCLFWSPTLM